MAEFLLGAAPWAPFEPPLIVTNNCVYTWRGDNVNVFRQFVALFSYRLHRLTAVIANNLHDISQTLINLIYIANISRQFR